nr:PREDICTED: serpin E3 [Anolis carolinensis]|eukprot:XP_016850740.1 PREDICTED: serpin E3 [Anolis carolinensis]
MLPASDTILLLLSLWSLNVGSCDHHYNDPKNLNTEFALSLYQRLAELDNGTNLVISPASISLSLGLLQFGAQGNTFAQLKRALGYNTRDQDMREFLHKVYKEVSNSKQGPVAQLACALFVQAGIRLLPQFVQHAAFWANNAVQQTNFSEPNRTAAQINEWIATNIGGKVKTRTPFGDLITQTLKSMRSAQDNLSHAHLKLISLGKENTWNNLSFQNLPSLIVFNCQLFISSIESPLNQVAVVSTMYFKSTWQRKFTFTDTQSLSFTTTEGITLKVPTLYLSAEVNYGEFLIDSLERISVVELPYLGETVSMFVVLPSSRRTSLAEVESYLSVQSFPVWSNSLRRTKMDIFLPRFRIQNHLDLKMVLPALGITDMFDSTQADFKGISEQGSLYISEAIHKAKIEVTEDGTRASGVTAMVLLKRSRAPVFKADRPFNFLLWQASTGSILFIGRLTNPTE